jgi:hypothetical protein
MNVHATQPAGRQPATFLQDSVEIASTLTSAESSGRVNSRAAVMAFGIDAAR